MFTWTGWRTLDLLKRTLLLQETENVSSGNTRDITDVLFQITGHQERITHRQHDWKKMISMVLLVVLTSSVREMSAVTVYQAEEDDDITIRWDSTIKTDMSLTNMRCFLWSNPVKLFYEMFNSVEVPESQDPQFAGRVQCDRDALRDGRIRLHVSRLRTEDSGSYWCDLAANYNKSTGRWVLATTEHFVLNVTSGGENRGHEEHNIITPASTEDAEHTPGGPEKEGTSVYWNKVATRAVVLIGAIICLLAVAQSCLSALIRQCNQDQHQDRCAITELMTEINPVHRLRTYTAALM